MGPPSVPAPLAAAVAVASRAVPANAAAITVAGGAAPAAAVAVAPAAATQPCSTLWLPNGSAAVAGRTLAICRRGL